MYTSLKERRHTVPQDVVMQRIRACSHVLPVTLDLYFLHACCITKAACIALRILSTRSFCRWATDINSTSFLSVLVKALSFTSSFLPLRPPLPDAVCFLQLESWESINLALSADKPFRVEVLLCTPAA